MDQETLLARALANKSTVTPLVGTLVAASAAGFIVDVGGGRIPARCATSHTPAVNDSVNVWFIDGTPYVVAPTTPQADQGTVVSVGSGLVTVTTQFGDLTIPYSAALTPVAGQVLHLTGKYADSVKSTSPAGGVAPPAPTDGVKTHEDLFLAVDAGSYGYGTWQRTEVWSSDHYQGAGFYGTKIPDTIPATAVIQDGGVQFYVSAKQIQGNPPNFALHAYPTKPGGPPALTGDTAVNITPGWITLPNSFGDSLKSGGGSFGVGIDHGGYSILHSLAEDSLSCALKITSVY